MSITARIGFFLLRALIVMGLLAIPYVVVSLAKAGGE